MFNKARERHVKTNRAREFFITRNLGECCGQRK
jgi:hypothetical protein